MKTFSKCRNEKISLALKGRHNSPSTEFKKGHPRSRPIGIHPSEETKRKISVTLKEKVKNGIFPYGFKKGYLPRNKGKHSWKNKLIECTCGCGQQLKERDSRGRIRKVIQGHNHNWLGRHHSKKTREKLRKANLGKHHSPETILKKSLSMRGEKNPFYGKKHSEETRKIISEHDKKLWQKEDYIKKQMRSRNVRPNKVEITLNSLLQGNFPKEWKYTGDGSVIIGGLCPDWINCNGKKKIIELFGCFFHGCSIHNPNWKPPFKARENIRREVFSRYGFNTLIVWEHELENQHSLIDKLKLFTEN